MAMKQQKTWKGSSAKRKAADMLAHEELVSRLMGVGLMLVSLLIFGVAGSISSSSGQGILGLLGIAVAALGLTLLITGASVTKHDGKGDRD